MDNQDLKKLAKKFPEQDIEWRVQQCGMGKKGPWALIIPYITSRAIQQRLDDVVGVGAWRNEEFKSSPCGNGYMCGISIKTDGEWVTKWDGAETPESNDIDNVKTAISNATKRAGVQWGIGRYLYQFDVAFAEAKHCDNRYDVLPGFTYQYVKAKNNAPAFGFQWRPKPLESWALPVTDSEIRKNLQLMATAENTGKLKHLFAVAYKLAVSEDDRELLDKFTQAKDKRKAELGEMKRSAESTAEENLTVRIDHFSGLIGSAANESAARGLGKIALSEFEKTLTGNELVATKKKINGIISDKIRQLNGVNSNAK